MVLIDKEKAIEIINDECGKYKGTAARIAQRLNKLPSINEETIKAATKAAATGLIGTSLD